MARFEPGEYHRRMSQKLVTPLPRNLIDAIANAGVDPADAAREAGIDAAALESGVTLAEADRFIDVACFSQADVRRPL